MKTENKPENKTEKKVRTNKSNKLWKIKTALLALFVVIVCGYEIGVKHYGIGGEGKYDSLTTAELEKILDKQMDMYFNITDDQDQTTFNEYESAFKAISGRLDKIEKDKANDYVYGYFEALNAEKTSYQIILDTIPTSDIKAASKIKNISFKTGEKANKIENLILKGLVQELTIHDMFIEKNSDGTYKVALNYEDLKETYKKSMSDYVKRYLDYQEKIAKITVTDAVTGMVSFDGLYEKLLLIDGIEGKDKAKDDFYWEFARLDAVSRFVGFGAVTFNDDDTHINQLYLEAMTAFVEKNKDAKNEYVSIMKEMVAQIEKDGVYGDNSLTIVNKFLNDSFKDYMNKIGEAQEETTETSESNK